MNISVKLLKGGSNTPLLQCYSKQTNFVIKQYGYESNNNSNVTRPKLPYIKLLNDDFKHVRLQIKKSNISVPEIIFIGYVNDLTPYNLVQNYPYLKSKTYRLVIFEEYCGISLKQLIISDQLKYSEKNRIVNEIETIIKAIPEDIEVDTNPANFTIRNNKIFFVDFMPPKLEGYKTSRIFCNLFPQIGKGNNEFQENRRYQYITTKGRLERFNYYLSTFISKAN